MDIPFNFSCDIIDFRYDFTKFNFETNYFFISNHKMYCQSNFISKHLKKNQIFLYSLICQSKHFLLFVKFHLKLLLFYNYLLDIE
jgi:hypothetical protein